MQLISNPTGCAPPQRMGQPVLGFIKSLVYQSLWKVKTEISPFLQLSQPCQQRARFLPYFIGQDDPRPYD